jgi:tetratricopeptide (TPR) repeat protein
VIATTSLGETHLVRGEYREAAKLLERNIGLDGKLRAERFGTAFIQSAVSEFMLSNALSHLGQFDEAVDHAEAAVRIAEENNHPWTLFFGLFNLSWAHQARGDFPRAARVLERTLALGHTLQFAVNLPDVAASLGYAYALAGRTEEALELAAGAVKEFRAGRGRLHPATFLARAGRAFLSAGRFDEATNYVREALALARKLGARGTEVGALFLMADVAAASGTENAEEYYREALALAEPRGMRPQVANCHFGLGKLYCRRGDRQQAQEHLTSAMAMYREMGMIYWQEQAEMELHQLG